MGHQARAFRQNIIITIKKLLQNVCRRRTHYIYLMLIYYQTIIFPTGLKKCNPSV